MQVRAGRPSTHPKRAENLAFDHGLADRHPDGGKVTVEGTHVRVDGDDHVLSGTRWIKAHVSGARGRGVHWTPNARGEVDPSVQVPAGTERVVGLEVETRTAKRLADHRSGNDAAKRQPRVARDLRRDDNPDETGDST